MSDTNGLRPWRVPTFCPICDEIMRGPKSDSSYYDWGCCYVCFIDFVADDDGRAQRWKDGWRPSAEDIARVRLTS